MILAPVALLGLAIVALLHNLTFRGLERRIGLLEARVHNSDLVLRAEPTDEVDF